MYSQNTYKFCFIICSNNEQYTNECIHHISMLHVPDGYTVDLLTITDAHSMTSGYNEGMNASDARYKIYLHQDVFILNKNILYDILNIFSSSDIGMIGVIGSVQLPKTAIMWHGHGPRVGQLYSNAVYYSYLTDFNSIPHEMCQVKAIDGLMMITQYDIPWREDLFTGWNFYDISQCLEFQKHGYKIVVPQTSQPWCFHDDGMMNLTHYYEDRDIFLRNYRDYL